MRAGYRIYMVALVLSMLPVFCAAQSWEGEYTQSNVTVKWLRSTSGGIYMRAENHTNKSLSFRFTSEVACFEDGPMWSGENDWDLGVLIPGVCDFWWRTSSIIPTKVKSFQVSEPDVYAWQNAIEGWHGSAVTLQYGRLNGDTFTADNADFVNRLKSYLAQLSSETEASLARQGKQKAIDFIEQLLRREQKESSPWLDMVKAINITVKGSDSPSTTVVTPPAQVIQPTPPAAVTPPLAPVTPPAPPPEPPKPSEPFMQLSPADPEQVLQGVIRDFGGETQDIIQHAITPTNDEEIRPDNICKTVMNTLGHSPFVSEGETPQDKAFAEVYDKIPRYIEYRKDGTFDENGKPIGSQTNVTEMSFYPSKDQYASYTQSQSLPQQDFDSACKSLTDPYAVSGPVAQPVQSVSPTALWNSLSDYDKTDADGSIAVGLQSYNQSAASSLLTQLFPQTPDNATAEEAFEGLMQQAQPWRPFVEGAQIFNFKIEEKADVFFGKAFSEIYPSYNE